MEVSDQPEAPAALPRCPLKTRLSGPKQGWIVLKRQNPLLLPGLELRTVYIPRLGYPITDSGILLSTGLALKSPVLALTAYNATYSGALNAEANVRSQAGP